MTVTTKERPLTAAGLPHLDVHGGDQGLSWRGFVRLLTTSLVPLPTIPITLEQWNGDGRAAHANGALLEERVLRAPGGGLLVSLQSGSRYACPVDADHDPRRHPRNDEYLDVERTARPSLDEPNENGIRVRHAKQLLRRAHHFAIDQQPGTREPGILRHDRSTVDDRTNTLDWHASS